MSRRDPWAVIRWAERQALERSLTPVQAHVLQVLATHADLKTCETRVARATIATTIRRQKSVTSQTLAELEALGLIERRSRGPGRSRATRLLVDVRPTGRPHGALTSGPPDINTTLDVRPTGPLTSGPPDPRRPAHRTQDYQRDLPEGLGSPPPSPTTCRREDADREGLSPFQLGDHGRPTTTGHDTRAQLAEHVRGILERGVFSLSENDRGRPWPAPTRAAILRVLIEHDPDAALAERVAWEAREIVQAQDRAPNVAGLYDRCLARALAERRGIRAEIADSLASASGGRP